MFNLSPDTLSSIVKHEPPEPLFRRFLHYRILWSLALAVFLADRVTKLLIVARLPFGTFGPPEAPELIPGFCYLAHVGNTGAAWSMFSGRSAALAVVAVLSLVGIYLWRRSLMLRLRLVQIAFGLLCGGIAGNLVDRIRYGHVVDFIDLRFGSYIYPTFNVADSGICIGIAVYLWYSLRPHAHS